MAHVKIRDHHIGLAPMPLTSLTAVSPLDGRYASQVDALRPYFSEFGLIRYRVRIEIEWLIALAGEASLPGIGPFSADSEAFLRGLSSGFSEADGERVKAIEATTNHDVKAIEYWLKERSAGNAQIMAASEFIHFEIGRAHV